MFLLLQYPQQWTELLLSLSPAAADQLLSYWDTLESDTAEGEQVRYKQMKASLCVERHCDSSFLLIFKQR